MIWYQFLNKYAFCIILEEKHWVSLVNMQAINLENVSFMVVGIIN